VIDVEHARDQLADRWRQRRQARQVVTLEQAQPLHVLELTLAGGGRQRHAADEQAEARHAERVDIGARVELAAVDHLARHVRQRALGRQRADRRRARRRVCR
jgi:hypothetical protein